jgi:hypothetical protein
MWLMREPARFSFQKHPPPAPQQNVRFLHKEGLFRTLHHGCG